MADVLTDPRLTTFGLFLETGDALARRTSVVYKRHNLSAREFSVLMRVARSSKGRLQMKDLAAQTATSTSGITTVVDRLVDAGLAERVLSDRDRRAWWVMLTEAGNAKVRSVAADMLPVLEDGFFSPLGDDEAHFESVLRRLRDGLHPAATSGAASGSTLGAGARVTVPRGT